MYKRTPLSIEVSKVLTLLMYTLFAMLLSTSAYFFVKTSKTAELGYSVKENQVRQKDLESENRILKQRVLDAQSIQELQQSEIVKDMVTPNQPLYVEPRGPLTKGKNRSTQNKL